ncbi:helix-turn-helix domain-containing protein (plasmid) [Streptomyces nojiriensis]|uniref:helix-turn-helix transcriptional regulator n=1 Tax=Streptomyces nojiriensis TaxID=66374 RepID=UPI002E17AACE
MNRLVPRPYAALAEHMMRLRLAAGLTQEQLGQGSGLSRSTVQRAESGTGAPSHAALRTAIGLCGGTEEDQRTAVNLRARGRALQRGRASAAGAPHRLAMRDRPDFQAVLAADFENAGAPPLGDFARHVPPGGDPIPRTSAWRISRRLALPATTGQLETWMEVCRVHPRNRQIYRDTYTNVTTGRIPRRIPARTRGLQALPASEATRRQDMTVPVGPGEPQMKPLGWPQLIQLLYALVLAEATRNGLHVEVARWPKGGGPDQSFRELGIDAVIPDTDGTLLLFQSRRSGTPPPGISPDGYVDSPPPPLPGRSAAISA